MHDAWPAIGGDPVVTGLTGIPGAGKTMAAASYVRARQAEGWRLVVWLAAQSADQIQAGLSALAHHLNLPREGEEAAVSARPARQRLAAFGESGLIVFDNAEEPAEVTRWFPPTGRLHIVVTRNRAFDRVHPCVEVGVFTPEEAVGFLRERTMLDQAAEASELAAELGDLPLALGQAAAVIPHAPSGAACAPRACPAPDATDPPAHDRPAAGVQPPPRPHSRDLACPPPVRGAGSAASIVYGAARSYGLTDPKLLSLCAAAGGYQIELAEPTHAAALLEPTLADQERLLGSDDRVTLITRNDLAEAYRMAGRFDQALDLFKATLEGRERTLGPDHPETLATRSVLASALRASGRVRQALELYQRTLAGREKTFGPDHPLTISSRGSVARALWQLGRERESLLVYERALADAERVLGSDHRDAKAIRGRFDRARAPRTSRFVRWFSSRRYYLPAGPLSRGALQP